MRGAAARRRAGAAFLHTEQIALHRPGFEKSGTGVNSISRSSRGNQALTEIMIFESIAVLQTSLNRNNEPPHVGCHKKSRVYNPNWFAMMPMTLNGPWSSRLSAALSTFCSVSLAFL